MADIDAQKRGKVLLTGGSGFIASHILDVLLEHGFTVVVAVRSAAKGQAIIDSIETRRQPSVSFVLVGDMAQEGAFDKAVQCEPPLDFVIHTASPYQLRVDDPVRDFLDPAVRGTTGLLRSVQTHAPSVRRVVLTSSSAAMLNPHNHAAVYDETSWRPMTMDDAVQPQNTYEASKVFAERAAWAFMAGTEATETADPATETKNSRPPFDLAVINGTYTFGPVQRWLARVDAVNASNQRIRDLVLGRWRADAADAADVADAAAGRRPGGGMPPTRPVFTWVDVRDVAQAHVRALLVPAAGGRRFYVVGGHFSNGRLAAIARQHARDLRLTNCLPPAEETPDDLPVDVYQFNNSRSREVLGMQYRSLETSVVDTIESILALEKKTDSL